MDHKGAEYHWIFSKKKKENLKKSSQQSHWHTASLFFSFFFLCVYMLMFVCMHLYVCEEGSVSLGINYYCSIPNYGGGGCRRGSQGRLEVGWQGRGSRGTDGSSGSGLFWADSWKQTHITLKSALVFSDFLCSDYYFSFWLKHTGREDSVSQPGLSKQVRDHQHSSEVFSFYRRDLRRTRNLKKKHTRARVTIQKKKEKKRQAAPHQSEWICNFWYIFW